MTLRDGQGRIEVQYATTIFDLDRTSGDPVSGPIEGEGNYYHNGESSRVHSFVLRPKYRLRSESSFADRCIPRDCIVNDCCLPSRTDL